MDRRGFGRTLLAGVAAAGAAQAAEAASSGAGALNGLFPGLKVRRNNKVRLGGEFRLGEGTTSPENIQYQQRWGIQYITTSLEGPRASPEALPVAAAAAAAARTNGGAKGGLAGRMTPSEPWNLDGLKHIRDVLAENGLVFEAIRADSAYMPMKPGPERARYLDVICDNVRKAGEAGVKVISQHWSINPLRRNISVPGRGGSSYTGFKLEADWKSMAPTGADPVSSDEYWERIDTFLKTVIPVCRQAGVKMATHPYDPGGLPLGYLGVDNYDAVDFAKSLLRYEKTFDDVHNGFQYDTGIGQESLPEGQSQLPLLHGLLSRGKIHQIHFRNVRGHLDDFIEVYHDEGDVNLFNIIRLLRDMGWEGSLLPDHSPNHPDDPGSLMGFAFANGYIKGLLQAADEEAIRVTQV